MVKYAHPRSLSGNTPRKLGMLYCSKTSGWHIWPYSVNNPLKFYMMTHAWRFAGGLKKV